MPQVITEGLTSVPPRFAWDNRVQVADSIVASSSDSGFPVENIATWRTFEQWRPSSLPATVIISWATAQEINAFCLYGHQIGVRDCSILCEYYDGTWNSFAPAASPASTEVLYFTSDTVNASQARITIDGPTLPPEIGNLFIGRDFQPESGIKPGFQPPAGAQDIKSREAISRNGLWRGVTTEDVVSMTTLTVGPIEEARAISEWRPFRARCQKRQPFYMHWNNSIDVNGAAYMTAAEFNGMPYRTPGYQDITIKARAQVD